MCKKVVEFQTLCRTYNVYKCDHLNAGAIPVSVFFQSTVQMNQNFFWVDPPPRLRTPPRGVSASVVAASVEVMVTSCGLVTKGSNLLSLISTVVRALLGFGVE